MAKTTVLVVDDEEDIRELVALNLNREGFKVIGADSGEQALKRARFDPPDLIVLDLMLPGMDGLEVCRKIKADPKTRQIPIVMLTAKSEDADVVVGLELGADDYMTKPFSGRVLVARVRRILRRRAEQADQEGVTAIHELTIDPARHEVLVRGRPVELTRTEFNIRDQIVDAIHGDNYLVTDRAVDVQIVSLRKKLGACAKYLETVRGVGYRFTD
jgi:two-component system alkaline phosphatase synthesis response regulator PhoP